MPRTIPTLLTSFGMLMLTACGGGASNGGDAASDAAMAAATASMADVTEPMELTDKDVENFIAILEEMKALGERYTDSDGDMKNIGAGIMASQKAQAVLRKYDYDPIKFQRVAYNISAAMAAQDMGDGTDLAADRKQLEAMKSQLPKEQYDMLVKAHEQMASMMTNQPAGNKDVVARWADRLDAVGRD
jgi:hypothetical protein